MPRVSRISVAVALTALLSGASCSSGPGDQVLDITYDVCQPLVVTPAADASPEELASVDDAIAMWNRLGETRLQREPAAGAAAIPVRFEAAAGAFYGVYEDEVGIVFVNRNLTDRHERAVTIAHELGHAFGLWHIAADVRPSVMNPANLTLEPDEADRRALVDVWGDCP